MPFINHSGSPSLSPPQCHVLTPHSSLTNGYECSICNVRAGGMDVLAAVPCIPKDIKKHQQDALAEQQRKLETLIALKKEHDRLAHLASLKRQHNSPPVPSPALVTSGLLG